jgi:catechol 2,3-dioxygenase-like lactoylglutathione lyase family enzyme
MPATVSDERSAVFDHVGLNVADYESSKRFFEQALAPLGYSRRDGLPEYGAVGLRDERRQARVLVGAREPRGTGTHVAFQAPTTPGRRVPRGGARGGRADNGAPGIRDDYHPTYYGAYVLDPDGNNVEARLSTTAAYFADCRGLDFGIGRRGPRRRRARRLRVRRRRGRRVPRCGLEAGGRDNGRPVSARSTTRTTTRLRPRPDGNNIEAVCHTPSLDFDVPWSR